MAELSTAQEEAAALRVSSENVHRLSWLIRKRFWSFQVAIGRGIVPLLQCIAAMRLAMLGMHHLAGFMSLVQRAALASTDFAG